MNKRNYKSFFFSMMDWMREPDCVCLVLKLMCTDSMKWQLELNQLLKTHGRNVSQFQLQMYFQRSIVFNQVFEMMEVVHLRQSCMWSQEMYLQRLKWIWSGVMIIRFWKTLSMFSTMLVLLSSRKPSQENLAGFRINTNQNIMRLDSLSDSSQEVSTPCRR